MPTYKDTPLTICLTFVDVSSYLPDQVLIFESLASILWLLGPRLALAFACLPEHSLAIILSWCGGLLGHNMLQTNSVCAKAVSPSGGTSQNETSVSGWASRATNPTELECCKAFPVSPPIRRATSQSAPWEFFLTFTARTHKIHTNHLKTRPAEFYTLSSLTKTMGVDTLCVHTPGRV